MFKLIGLTPEEAQAKFGYLLDCFEVRRPAAGPLDASHQVLLAACR